MDIYYHKIEGFQGLDSIKGIEGYCKRAAVMCGPHDVLLLDNYSGLELPPAELPTLNNLGLGPHPENIFVVEFSSDNSWQENEAANRQTLEKLASLPIKRLFPFSSKSWVVQELARHLGIEFVWSGRDHAFWGEDKATLIEMGSELGYVPKGYCCTSREDFLEAWQALAARANFSGEAVVKARQSASGLLSSVVRNPRELENFLYESGVIKLGGVLQEWHQMVTSPSINYYIHDSGVKELFVSEQLFEAREPAYGEEGTNVHAGNICPSNLTPSQEQKLREIAQPFAERFWQREYRGPVGFDAIVTDQGEILLVEANPRTTGPHYAYYPAQRKGAEAFHLQNQEVRPTTTPEQLVATLGDLMLNQQRSHGYFFFNFHPGKFTGVLLGKNRHDIDQMIVELHHKLKKLR